MHKHFSVIQYHCFRHSFCCLQPKTVAWSKQKEKKLKKKRSKGDGKRKKLKRPRPEEDEEDFDDLTRDIRLMKKLKSGKVNNGKHFASCAQLDVIICWYN